MTSIVNEILESSGLDDIEYSGHLPTTVQSIVDGILESSGLISTNDVELSATHAPEETVSTVTTRSPNEIPDHEEDWLYDVQDMSGSGMDTELIPTGGNDVDGQDTKMEPTSVTETNGDSGSGDIDNSSEKPGTETGSFDPDNYNYIEGQEDVSLGDKGPASGHASESKSGWKNRVGLLAVIGVTVFFILVALAVFIYKMRGVLYNRNYNVNYIPTEEI